MGAGRAAECKPGSKPAGVIGQLVAYSIMTEAGVQPGNGNPFDLNDESSYASWRASKLAHAAKPVDFIQILDPARLDVAERRAILEACHANNMAFYRAPALAGNAVDSRKAVASMIKALGLHRFEDHRSAEDDGVVAIEVSDHDGKGGFIPYTDRAINWHTDGYYAYRSPEIMIRSMVLHCVRTASKGGENGFFDHDIAYIRLRDLNPAFIPALMRGDAMTIPAFDDGDGKSHPAVTGPVFVPHADGLAMRFTVRKRNIQWADDATLLSAVDALREVLANDPLVVRCRLSPNEGVICNNVPHDRTAFENTDGDGEGRLMYRVRSYDRVGQEH